MFHDTRLLYTKDKLSAFFLLVLIVSPHPHIPPHGTPFGWISWRQVTLGVPASEIYAARSFQSSPAAGQAGRTWRLNEHVPDARLTIRLRCVHGGNLCLGVGYVACCRRC